MARSKVFKNVGQTPMSRSQGQKFWSQQKGLVASNTHLKYESPNSYHSKVMANVKVFLKVGQHPRSQGQL